MNQGSTVRVALSLEAFTALVNGQEATLRGYSADGVVTVEIILSDIGFAQMREAINRAAQTGALNDVDPADVAKIIDLSERR
jgi:hypothetical protein